MVAAWLEPGMDAMNLFSSTEMREHVSGELEPNIIQAIVHNSIPPPLQ